MKGFYVIDGSISSDDTTGIRIVLFDATVVDETGSGETQEIRLAMSVEAANTAGMLLLKYAGLPAVEETETVPELEEV